MERLPKWAQNELRRLAYDIRSLEQKLSEFAGKAGTNTFLREGMDKMPLPKNGQIEFFTGHGNENKVCVYVHSDGNVYVHSDSRLSILLSSSNAFRISFV